MRTLLLLSALWFISPLPAQESKPPASTLAINWVFPGHFADALLKARTQQRLMMIKGIAFGIDDLGATCATKGCW